MEPLSPATGGSVRARGRILTRHRTTITTAQSSEVIRSLIYPIAGQLFGGLLPEGLRALLVP